MTQAQLSTPYASRIGLTRACDAVGAIVALDGHWHDVLSVKHSTSGPQVLLETLSPSGALFYRHLDPSTVLQESLDHPRLSRSGGQL